MRKATVEGRSGLVRHLAELMPEEADESSKPDVDPQIDARQALYAQISEVISENIETVKRAVKTAIGAHSGVAESIVLVPFRGVG